MLGRLRLSVDKAIKAYGDFASKVFSDKKLLWQDGMFKASNLEKAIRAIIQESIGDPDAHMIDPSPSSEGCKTYVHMAPSSHYIADSSPVLFARCPQLAWGNSASFVRTVQAKMNHSTALYGRPLVLRLLLLPFSNGLSSAYHLCLNHSSMEVWVATILSSKSSMKPNSYFPTDISLVSSVSALDMSPLPAYGHLVCLTTSYH
jgi:hypothetical protein